jgi:YVTN family beta-propeller protein
MTGRIGQLLTRSLSLLGVITLVCTSLIAANAHAKTQVTTIPVGGNPTGVAFSPNGLRAFITNTGSNSVSVLDTRSESVIATIPVGQSPVGIAITPDGSRGFVTNYESASVSVLDLSQNTSIATIPVGHRPYAVTVAPNGATVWVSNFGSTGVSVLDSNQLTVITTIPILYPRGLAISPDGSTAWVAGYSAFIGNGDRTQSLNFNGVDGLFRIDASRFSVMSGIPINPGRGGNINAWDVAVSPSGHRIWVTNPYAQQVAVVDPARNAIVSTIEVPTPWNIALDSDGTSAWVTNSSGTAVSEIDTQLNVVTTSIAVNSDSRGIALSPIENVLYITLPKEGQVAVVRTLPDTPTTSRPAKDVPRVWKVRAVPRVGGASVSWRVTSKTSDLKGFVVTATPGGQTCSTQKMKCEFSSLRNTAQYQFRVQALGLEGGRPAVVSNKITTLAPPKPTRPPQSPPASPQPKPPHPFN